MRPIVFLETQIVCTSVLFRIELILSSFVNCAWIATGTIQTESLQHASSVMNHSGLLSEKIAMNLQSGVPLVLLLMTGQSLFLIKELDRASTMRSVSSNVCHWYSPSVMLSGLGKYLLMLLV